MNFGITKISARGQIIIPKEIRKEKNIKAGTQFLIYSHANSIILKPIVAKNNSKALEKLEEFLESLGK